MKAINYILHIFARFLYHIIAFFTLIFFLALVSVFLLFVFIKANPVVAEKFIMVSFNKMMEFAKVEVHSVNTTVVDEKVTITIEKFSKNTKGINLHGVGMKIYFSLMDLVHGRLYKITINNFAVNIITAKNENSTDNAQKSSISRLYSLIPALKIEIKNFVINVNNDNIHLKNSLLVLNQKGYTLLVSTTSTEDNYKLNVALNSQVLRISFRNIPETLFHTHTKNKFHFVHFNSINGFVEFDSKNLSNADYRISFEGLSLDKSHYIPQKISISNSTIYGETRNGFIKVSLPEVSINYGGKVSFTVNISKEKQDISVVAKNFQVNELQQLIPWSLINKTHFKELTKYLLVSIKSGLVRDVLVGIHLPIQKQEDISVKVAFEDVEFEYNKFFAPIQNAYGLVDVNAHNTTVLVKKANSIGNDIKNLTVGVNHKILNIDCDLLGSPLSIANIFFPEHDLQKYTAFLSAKSSTKAAIVLDLSCKDILKCSSFNVVANLSNLQTIFNELPTGATMNVMKYKNQNIQADFKLNNFTNQYFDINTIKMETEIEQNFAKFSAKIKKNNNTLLWLKSMKVSFQDNFQLHNIDLPIIKFSDNDFSINYQNANLIIKGQSVNIPVLHEIISKFHQEKSQNKFINGGFKNLQLGVHVKNAIFFQNLHTSFDLDTKIESGNMESMLLDSDIIRFHYFSEKQQQVSSEKQQGIFIEIPDIKSLTSAVTGESKLIQSGSLNLNGDRNDDGSVTWFGYLKNFRMSSEKFKFRPEKVKINAILQNHILKFKRIKVQDQKHTMFFTGKIFTDNFTTQTKVFYTPSKIEFLNELPLLKDAFKVTTFGGSKQGLLSFEIDVYGSILEPQIKFKKSSSVKSLWKFGFGVVLLPLLLL